ncbi:hypothetical protein FIV42_25500 [Persicimonas caeni]|uniref:Uncharacterized protein n=1 Tax=Persicimonas caeni TaxID=2292766 RepID=A0A4Y6Q1V0_PERCE|nr:hypothetical protein [Persicimonas caeni]QDG53975.1 hypothetical protein FIV42_25500 [Persicimonas caeni]QED35196.1 hypothetical protein FRD00_25495 [Persicimonas caeni]
MASTAAAEDGVAIIPNGGATEARVFDLDTSQADIRVRDRGRRQLVSDALGPVAIRDLKILPDDANLLSDVDGRGIAITETDGSFSYSFASATERPRVTSASVTAYAGLGAPTRVLVTDSNRSLAFVVDPQNDEWVWQQSFAMPGARATFAQAIALPSQRAAFGINWTALGLSAVDVYTVQSGEPTTIIRRLASAQHPDPPPETVIVPELAELRDLMGLPNGNLLVTTRFGLSEITTEGDVVWKVDIGESAELRGEFATARLVPSGRIAVATFEPGVWTSPHEHHRVHWLSASELESERIEVLASTDALEAAPARIEVADGHGGSGTFGYRPGLDAVGSGELSDLEMARDLAFNAAEYAHGDWMFASALLENTGTDTVTVSQASILATPGACGASTQAPRAIVEATALEIGAGETFELQDSLEIDDSFTLGRWCAKVVLQDVAGNTVELGTPGTFDVVEDTGGGSSTVIVRDLGHWSADAADVGVDMGVGDAGQDPEPGCACSASGRSVELSWVGLLLWGAGSLLWRRRRL